MPLTGAVLFRTRVERVIASVRVALASAAMLALWLDPPTLPTALVQLTYSLHVIYLIYALVLAAVMWHRDSRGRVPLVTHIADVVIAASFQVLTAGASSPFFTYFTFALFSAALRWGWQATFRTAVLVSIAYVAFAVPLGYLLVPSPFDLNKLISRFAYLMVLAVVLVYLGQHEARLRGEIQRLAKWPMAVGGSVEAAVLEILGHAAPIMSAQRAVLVWSTEDEPWTYLLTWPATTGGLLRQSPGRWEPIVPEGLADATFLRPGASTESALAPLVTRGGTAAAWQGPLVHPEIARHLGDASLASAPVRSEQLSGRVFFTDLATAGPEIVPLVEVVGREIGLSLDRIFSYERSRQIAVAEDRIRLARDLHDGVLQSLTGIRLELQSLADEGAPRDATLPDRLLALERAIAIEQRELRQFIEDLRPAAITGQPGSLAQHLEELRARLALEWRTPITVRVSPPDLAVSGLTDRAVPLMVHEAVVNALKHGDPSRVAVDIHLAGDWLRILVTDDGRGFRFKGRLDHQALLASNAAPVSLKERLVSLGGEMAIESTASGSRVELSLPLGVVHA